MLRPLLLLLLVAAGSGRRGRKGRPKDATFSLTEPVVVSHTPSWPQPQPPLATRPS